MVLVHPSQGHVTQCQGMRDDGVSRLGMDHGEVSHAYAKNLIKSEQLIEIGEIISNQSLGRKNKEQITIADLTGVAVQDIQITKAIIK